MDFSQGELISESFAVRFKTEEPAALFKQKFEECQSALRNASSRYLSNEASVLKCPSCETTKPGEQPKNEAVDKSIIFENRCTLSSLEGGPNKSWTLLGTGNLKILYDEEMLCAKITVVEDGNKQLLCDTVIAVASQLKVVNYFSIFQFLFGLILLFVNV